MAKRKRTNGQKKKNKWPKEEEQMAKRKRTNGQKKKNKWPKEKEQMAKRRRTNEQTTIYKTIAVMMGAILC
jgi:hypothetical protein